MSGAERSQVPIGRTERTPIPRRCTPQRRGFSVDLMCASRSHIKHLDAGRMNPEIDPTFFPARGVYEGVSDQPA
jgi:hypothetical protein